MSEPKCWLEQGASRDVEDLIRAARAEQPSERSLQHTLSAIGVGIGAGAIAGSAAASASVAATASGAATASSAAGTAKVSASITAGVLAKWTALGATLGTLGVGGAAIVTHALPEAKPPTSSASSPAQPRPSSRVAVPALARTEAEHEREAPFAGQTPARATSSPVAPLDTAASAALSPNQRRSAGSSTLAASAVPLEAETLAEEVKNVDRARAALAAGRPSQTLWLLDEYERRFPARGFAPEALYLRMEALTALGQTAQALAAAERLLASYPDSPQGARARVLLSKNP